MRTLDRSDILTALVTSALLFPACATTPTVSTTYVSGIHLERYKTYAFVAGDIYDFEAEKIGDSTGVGPALEADVQEELGRRGLKRSDGNPDLVFTYAGAKRLEHAGERAWPYQEGALDLIAKDKTGQTVWSTHLQTVIDPTDKTHRHLKEAIQRAFKKYPAVT